VQSCNVPTSSLKTNGGKETRREEEKEKKQGEKEPEADIGAFAVEIITMLSNVRKMNVMNGLLMLNRQFKCHAFELVVSLFLSCVCMSAVLYL
jgi:flagellar biosynthesis/type III secretory pathway chaperone